MFGQISAFFTIEMIYSWLNFGILPFWFVLIFFPQSRISRLLATSIFPFIVLGAVYIYLLYYFFIDGYDFLQNFELYLGIYNLANLFENEAFLILFWTHFLTINLFCAAWIVRDSQKYFMSKYLNILPLVVTYFVGPVGIFVYWIIRIFFAKKISLFD
tara:strand:- start:1157 stop:1630 length:474 start_codon:yes stop_codon:yes gene_type:complete